MTTPTPNDAPMCHCGHDMYSHYMCGDPRKMWCHRGAECGCIAFHARVLHKREKWERDAYRPVKEATHGKP